MEKEILRALKNSSGSLTVRVKSDMQDDTHKRYTTSQIRRELKKLEEAGLVERRPTVYKSQISWALVPPATNAQGE